MGAVDVRMESSLSTLSQHTLIFLFPFLRAIYPRSSFSLFPVFLIYERGIQDVWWLWRFNWPFFLYSNHMIHKIPISSLFLILVT